MPRNIVSNEGQLVNGNYRGQMTLATGTTLTYGADDTYEKVVGNWSDGTLNYFTVDDVNDRLIYNGPSGVNFFFVGVSDIAISAADIIHYALFINGNLVPGAETPHSFDSPAKTTNISITRIFSLNHGDYLEVWSKCVNSGRTITIGSLAICCWGDR